MVAPTLPTRFEWLASATDKRREQADARLGTVLGQLQELDSDAEGEVGADDPLLAFDDVRRDFEPDHVLISLRSQSGWQERGLLDDLMARFEVPITAFNAK